MIADDDKHLEANTYTVYMKEQTLWWTSYDYYLLICRYEREKDKNEPLKNKSRYIDAHPIDRIWSTTSNCIMMKTVLAPTGLKLTQSYVVTQYQKGG